MSGRAIGDSIGCGVSLAEERPRRLPNNPPKPNVRRLAALCNRIYRHQTIRRAAEGPTKAVYFPLSLCALRSSVDSFTKDKEVLAARRHRWVDLSRPKLMGTEC
jgi:hypothetical protein